MFRQSLPRIEGNWKHIHRENTFNTQKSIPFVSGWRLALWIWWINDCFSGDGPGLSDGSIELNEYDGVGAASDEHLERTARLSFVTRLDAGLKAELTVVKILRLIVMNPCALMVIGK